MATFTKSDFEITFGASLVLLAFDGRMTSEPALLQTHESELVPFARALNPVGFHYGNIGYSLDFDHAVDYGSKEAARNAIFDHLIVTDAERVETVKIEIAGGSTYNLANSVLQSVTPEMSPDLGSRNWRVLWKYSIVGGALTKV